MSRFFLALGFCTIFLLFSRQNLLGEKYCGKPFIVLEVNFPADTHLSAQEQAAARVELIGACLGESQLGQMADGVRRALKEAGYLRATSPSLSISNLP
jgi:hypothetical protein